jgi:CheY-like chemotaxis protein
MVVSPALRRAQLLAPVLQAAQVLWVDDNPASVRAFCGILNSLGLAVDLVTSSSEALARTADKTYHLIVSDIERDGVTDEGLAFLRALQRRGAYPKIIFFISNFDPKRGTPQGAFGITNSGEELLHLVFDALERECL